MKRALETLYTLGCNAILTVVTPFWTVICVIVGIVGWPVIEIGRFVFSGDRVATARGWVSGARRKSSAAVDDLVAGASEIPAPQTADVSVPV